MIAVALTVFAASMALAIGIAIILAQRFLGIGSPDLSANATAIAIAGFVVLVYLWPSMSAAKRHHPQFSAILALNLLLGWTFLGWVAAMVWALAHTSPAQVPAGQGGDKPP